MKQSLILICVRVGIVIFSRNSVLISFSDNLSSHLEQLLVKYSISASQINLQEVVGQGNFYSAVGRLQFIYYIKIGEFGIVYRALLATDTDIPQVVAVKTLKGMLLLL